MQYLKKQLKVLIEVVVKDSPIHSDEIKLSKTNINRKLTLEEKYKEILQLQEKGENQTEICHAVNMDVRCYKKLISANETERNQIFKNLKEITHEEKVVN